MMGIRMANRMHRFIPWVIAVAATCAPAMADEGEGTPDARLTMGYPTTVTHNIPVPSTALAWMTLIGLGLVCVGPLFLNAKRTHLD
jgi:hypothetical protein